VSSGASLACAIVAAAIVKRIVVVTATVSATNEHCRAVPFGTWAVESYSATR
jgi:hypothetical protein